VRIQRFESRELLEVRARIIYSGEAVATNVAERIEDVSEVSRGEVRDARPFRLHSPRREIANDASGPGKKSRFSRWRESASEGDCADESDR
jgi:hypothetical protein